MSKTATISLTGISGGGSSGSAASVEFDVPAFEQRLKELKDTQDSIQQLSAWCLQRRAHHKKIVTSWLNVLKQVKVEHRLILFYLANDVIQYSKRKNYEYVDSWGTYLQKATTLVRDEKVKHKILRIFKIWEQREIYNDEFLADLNGLLSATSAKKPEPQSAPSVTAPAAATLATGPTRLAEAKQAVVIVDIDDFQTASLVSTIKDCVKNETDTDATFKSLNKTPLVDVEAVMNSIKGKDRKSVEDVEREIEENLVHYQSYVHSLKTELKSRKLLISLLEQAETFYHNQRGEVKVVANAYRNFGNRLKSMKKKLDELTTTLPSPIPSPDINAPSPPPDMDLQLPDDQSFFNVNGMMNSYMDGNLPFDISDFRRDSPTPNTVQPIQVIGSRKDETEGVNDFLKTFFPDTPNQHYPASRQSVPSHTTAGSAPYVPSHSSNSSLEDYALGSVGGGVDYTAGLNSYGVPSSVVGRGADYGLPGLGLRQNNHPPAGMVRNYGVGPQYNQPMLSDYPTVRPQPVPRGQLLPPPQPVNLDRSDEYNSTWDMSMTWDGPQDSSGFQNLDTPVSPPHYERKGLNPNVIEYIDDVNEEGPLQDVDHRQLPSLPMPAFMKEKGRLMDVDHRNLISLTGSPGPLKSSLDDLEDIDDDDDDADILLTGETRDDSVVKEKSISPVVSSAPTNSIWTDNGDVDLRHSNITLLAPAPVPPPTTTASSSTTSIATTVASEPKDLDMRIQSMQQALDSRFGVTEPADENGDEEESSTLPIQLLQTPTSLLEIDDFLQNFERENFDLSKPPTVLMSNQKESSLSPVSSLMEMNSSTPNRALILNDDEQLEKKEKDNNESVDMDLSDEEEYVPEHPTDSASGKSGTSLDKLSPSSLSPETESMIPTALSPSGPDSTEATDNSLSVIKEGSHDSTEPYEPFEGEDFEDELPELPEVEDAAPTVNTLPQQRPPLLPDPDFPPFAFNQEAQHQAAQQIPQLPPPPPPPQPQILTQQQQPSQRKQWDIPPPQLNNFAASLPNLVDMPNFGEFPNLSSGLNTLNQPPPAGGLPPPPHMWNNQMGPSVGGSPMGPLGPMGPMGGSPNRPPFVGSPFNNKNFRNNNWGGRGGGMGMGGGIRPNSPYFRGGMMGRGGGRGNFRGANNRFRGGHHGNNRGGNWLDSFIAEGGDVLQLIQQFAPQ